MLDHLLSMSYMALACITVLVILITAATVVELRRVWRAIDMGAAEEWWL